VSMFRRGFADSRDRPGTTGNDRGLSKTAPDRIHAGQGLFPQVVAGDGFEPS
jgi:hypothetical protein